MRASCIDPRRPLKKPTKIALEQKRQLRNPQEAESRRLTKPLDSAQSRIDRLLDAYTDGAVDLADYKRRRAEVQSQVEDAQRRLAELDAAPAQEPAAPVVRSFADTWPTLSVEVRRDVADALLTESVCSRQDGGDPAALV
jgi:hypothetical protein